ncbi:MAG: nucleotidyltransferase domain-containing protein [Lachnospiraceae bacterium]|nr:nucleotidyltransferase domain-containing protein [Lachnospiraceae bacterium]
MKNTGCVRISRWTLPSASGGFDDAENAKHAVIRGIICFCCHYMIAFVCDGAVFAQHKIVEQVLEDWRMGNDILSLETIVNTVKPVALKYRVESIYLFGSYARGDATKESDLDFLVFGGKEFKLTMIFALAEELRETFKKDIDMFEINEINKDTTFYDTIMKERVLVV